MNQELSDTSTTPEQRAQMIADMRLASKRFYAAAIAIGNHPFIEFTGLINEYITICEQANASGVDFTECNTHGDKDLPMASHQINYINEKLECIFTGRSVMKS